MVDILDIADMVVVVAVDRRKSWNRNGGTVGYGLMIMEKIIGLSAIDDYCNVGKDVDGNEGTVGYGSIIVEKTIGLFAESKLVCVSRPL